MTALHTVIDFPSLQAFRGYDAFGKLTVLATLPLTGSFLPLFIFDLQS
jgi:hypothetical protein